MSVTASGLSTEQSTAEDNHKDARTYSKWRNIGSGCHWSKILETSGKEGGCEHRLLRGVSISEIKEAGRTMTACVFLTSNALSVHQC